MAKRIIDSALLIDWRALRPLGSGKARSSWRVYTSTQLINWRAWMGPATAGGGDPVVYLSAEADGVGNASVELTGPAVTLDGEADGLGQAQCSQVIPPTIHGEPDGVGNAQCYLLGGTVSVTCLTQGFSGASPPSPGGSIAALADAPYSY